MESCQVSTARAWIDPMAPRWANHNNARRITAPKESLADDLQVHGLFNLCRILDFHKAAPHLLFSSTSALFGSPGLRLDIFGLLCAVKAAYLYKSA